MATWNEQLNRLAGGVWRNRGLILPIAAASMIFVLLVPLPPALLDVLLAAAIAMAAIILITTIHVGSPLEFSVFPSVLLGATLTRLVLNVATTRLILTAGADGRDIGAAQQAAGRVVWAFSQFVTGDSLAVGVILFAILAIIQFVVVTKGATRISEVAARFMLDAMPGKQMAIDADLNAGLINDQQARTRRSTVASEADFYGAMDGASRFLRGDAVAAVIITAVNILGGLYVGIVQYHWNWSQSVDLFTRLTIGEGLVMQVPAFILSISSALIVTRSTSRTNLGEEVVGQLTSKPVALVITGIFLCLLAMTNLPTAPLLLMGGGCVGVAWMLQRGAFKGRQDAPAASQTPATTPVKPAPSAEEVLTVDPMRVDLGYALVRLVDASQGGDLLEKIAVLRRQVAADLGLMVPPIRIRDDLRLEAHNYAVRLRGQTVASGRLYANQYLAVCGEHATGKVIGREVTDPVSGMPAVWISQAQRERAEMMNYAVTDAATVLTSHLSAIIRRHAAELLTRQQVERLLEGLKPSCPSLVAEATERLGAGKVQRVLQNLLRENVSIGDLEGLLEAMTEAAAQSADATELTEHLRVAMGRTLSRQYCDREGKLWCVCLDEELEDALGEHSAGVSGLTVGPELAQRVMRSLGQALVELRRQGKHQVVLCAPPVRAALRKLISTAAPEAAVLAYSEIDSVEVQTIATVGIGT